MRKRFLILCIASCCGVSSTTLVACGDDDDGNGGSHAGSGGSAGHSGSGGSAGHSGSGGAAGTSGVGGSGGSGGADAGVMTTVAVSVEEFSVHAVPATAPAGQVTFKVTNHGSFEHEFVVIDTDLAPRNLPIKDGEVDENAASLEVVDELEGVMPGGTESLTVELTAGKYVLICNRTIELDDGGVFNHYVQGMSTAFTVE